MYLEGIEIEHWLEWENFVKIAGNKAFKHFDFTSINDFLSLYVTRRHPILDELCCLSCFFCDTFKLIDSG